MGPGSLLIPNLLEQAMCHVAQLRTTETPAVAVSSVGISSL
jgi:hypothetical protein